MGVPASRLTAISVGEKCWVMQMTKAARLIGGTALVVLSEVLFQSEAGSISLHLHLVHLEFLLNREASYNRKPITAE